MKCPEKRFPWLFREALAAIGLVSVALLIAAAGPRVSSAEEARQNILLVSSFFKDVPSQTAFESGMDEVLGYSEGRHNLYFEFMDSPRVEAWSFDPVYADYLEKKYEGIQFYVVMGWSTAAIKFLKGNEALFPSAHRVYVEDTEPETEDMRPENHVTSLDVRVDWNASLAEVLRLEKPESIYVIGSTEGEKARSHIRHFKDSVKALSFGGEVEYLVDRPMEEVAGTLEKLPRRGTVAIYLLMFSDGQGAIVTPYRAAQYLCSRSAVPVYSNWESLIGSGIVGGHLMSQYEIGKKAAEIALSPDAVKPVLSVVPMRYVYDWTALKRWAIPEGRLPRDAVVVNRPPDVLSAYRWQIVAGMAVILGLAVLSLFLVRVVKLRNTAVGELAEERRNLTRTVEERTRELVESNRDLLDSEERFRNLSDASFEGVAFIENGVVSDANAACREMFGYLSTEVIGRSMLDFIDPDEREIVGNIVTSGYAQFYETRGLKKDGTVFPIQIHGKTFSYRGRSIRVTAIRDLTELKKSQEEIKTLRGILPVCASCKKFRDDQGYWNQIEMYIQEHSEAMVSHSICPDCKKRLYPDLD